MRKPIALIASMLLAIGLAGCGKAEKQGTYNDTIETGTVCIGGYLYAWSAPSMRYGFDMEPMGQVCEVNDDAA